MSDKNFRVRHGLEVGDTVSVDATSGDIITDGTIQTDDGTTGEVTIGGSSQGKIEIGQYNRATSGTPYIDFHSSANAVDYDVRLIASGGSGTDGQGTLTVTAATTSVGGDLTVTGNLTVNGDTTTLNTATLSVEDNIVILNSNVTGTPSLNAGIEVERGTSTNSALTWNESTDKWYQDRAGTSTVLAVNTDELTEGSTNLYYTDARSRAALSGGTGVTYSTLTGQISIGQSVGTTDNVTFGDVAVNGGDITTNQTTGTLYNTTATTVSIGGAATTTNIGATTGSSIIAGANRLTSPTIFNFAGANNYRGLLLSNLNSGTLASARNGLVMRTASTSSTLGPRGGIVFENARSNASGVLAALQGPSTTQVGDYLGEIVAGGYATDRYTTEAVATTTMAFTPYATETWVNSGTTVSNAGTGWALQLQPTATNLSATSKITTIDTTPQNLSLRSDIVGVSKGKTTQFIATGCSTSGTTLTIGTLSSGSISVGSMIQNSTNLLPAGTYIVANISGSGSGSTWTLNQSPGTLSSLTIQGAQGFVSMSGSGNVDVIGQLTTRGPIRYALTNAGNFAGGATYTPASTVSNSISCTINSGTGGFVVALTNLIADSNTGGHYQIFVQNSSGSNQTITTTGGAVNINHNLSDGSGMMITIYIVGTNAFCEHIA